MKNKIKLFTALFSILGIFILTGCNNPFSPINLSPDSPQHEKGLLITLSGEGVGARTLYPEVPVFTKYELTFDNGDDRTREMVVIDDDRTSVIVDDLVLGYWTITAKGYVTINGNLYVAAEGSNSITIERAPAVNSLNITLHPVQYESYENGTLSYDLTFLVDKVDNGEINIYPLDMSYSIVSRSFNQQASKDTISLSPGFYIMVIRLYEQNRPSHYYQPIIRTEIIHIYSNIETKAEYTFEEKDFNEFITLSGTIDVRINGESPDSFTLNAYLNGYSHQIGRSNFSSPNLTSWSMVLPAYDDDVNVYFRLTSIRYDEHNYYCDVEKTVTVGKVNVAEDIGRVDVPIIILSGTIHHAL